ncbi:MAG: H-type small acid-soluble spore protein [Firmicutes bacterium]|nr:H-type small acid-soluble spore protein [Bacillota bacterium]
MDFKRAEEIYHSLDKINVFHQGNAVWMQNLDAANHTAEIEYLEGEDTFAKVSVTELSE